MDVAAQYFEYIVVRRVLGFLDRNRRVIQQERQRGKDSRAAARENRDILARNSCVIKVIVIISDRLKQRRLAGRFRVFQVCRNKLNRFRQRRSTWNLCR